MSDIPYLTYQKTKLTFDFIPVRAAETTVKGTEFRHFDSETEGTTGLRLLTAPSACHDISAAAPATQQQSETVVFLLTWARADPPRYV